LEMRRKLLAIYSDFLMQKSNVVPFPAKTA
jgi:hypothetical protein